MICVVSYALNPKRAIDPFIAEIKSPPAGWAHYIDDMWVLATKENVHQLHERLARHLNILPSGGDHLFIAAIQPDAASGWLPKDFWEWYEQNKYY